MFYLFISGVPLLMMVVPGFACVCPEFGLEEVSGKLSISIPCFERNLCNYVVYS
ncbi:hypothetical protein KC19_8G116000 [Ceratodon purpureus]|uniref:NADH dehydrogenase subunit 1 n=1 Tax=Ceratodon purpureus TaxID=3225 RepID=A0A8T0H328_CERPU|nr:hypothetical protein KC19_8G116000 [Ceratodon purpureus]